MRKLFFILSILILFSLSAQALTPVTYSEGELWGLRDNNTQGIIVEPIYKRIIRVGNNSWIVQNKRNKYGLIDDCGEVLIPLKYNHADRIVSKFVKFGNFNDFGVYDEFGKTIVEPKYQKVEILYGQMFLTYKDFKYGIVGHDGRVIVDNEFDDIYMPQPNVMRLKLDGKWYELEQVKAETLTLPAQARSTIREQADLDVRNIVLRTGVVSGYSVLTFSDYVLKVFSSISPSHEDTIDELMLSQGADTVNIFMKMTWLPKYPFVFARKYYRNIRNPYNGPLTEVRTELLNQTKVDEE